MAGISEAAVAARPGPQALFTKLSPGPGLSPAEVAEHQRARIHNAVVEIVGEHGYEAATIREIARLAGVSSRALYQHYESKEDCFLRTHEAVVRLVVRRMLAAQSEWDGWRGRLRATFEAFSGELGREPRLGRLLLVEAYSAGPDAIGQVRRAERTFEARIAECFIGAEEEIAVSPLLVKAIAFGMLHLMRSRLLEQREVDVRDLSISLFEWAVSLCSDPATEETELDRQGANLRMPPGEPSGTSTDQGDGARDPVGDRALIFDAVSKLVLSDGYCDLTIPAVCLAAGLSRRRFQLQYTKLADCFVDAAELRIGRAFARAEEAATDLESSTWERRVESSLSSLCHSVASDRALQRLGFDEVLCPGPRGLATCGQAVERVRALIAGPAAGGGTGDDVSTEASAGAIWGLLGSLVADGCRWGPSQTAQTAAFLALAPAAAADPVGPG